MKRIALTFWLLPLLVLGFSTGNSKVRAQPQKPTSEVLNVSLCQLVSDPQVYDRKLVRLNAIYAVNFEWVLLYDCKCIKRDSYIYPIIAGDTDELSRSMEKALAKNLKHGRKSGDRVGLVLTGVFLAPPVNQSGQEPGSVWPNFRIRTIEKFTEIPEAATAPADCPSRKK